MASEVARKLPVGTSDALILTLTDWLMEKLKVMDFGEVALNFVVHQGAIVRYEKIERKSCLADRQRDRQGRVAENE